MDIDGTPVGDRLQDTPGDDVVHGKEGGDTITVTNGHDLVDGGEGRDLLEINWGAATDPVTSAPASSGFDARYVSGAGRSVDFVGIERLIITGGRAGDTIFGLGGDDLIFDAQGATPDDDVLNGGGGNDQISVLGGHDRIDGGDGLDAVTVDWQIATAPIHIGTALSGYDIRLESGADRSADITGAERLIVYGGQGDDVVVTQSGADIYYDNAFVVDSDAFDGGAGDDEHDVLLGHDRGDGGAGNDLGYLDWYKATAPVVMATPAAGYDIRFVSGSDRSVDWKNFEHYVVQTGTGSDDVLLPGGNDFILDAGGNDRFDGGGGDDGINAGPGNDQVFGGEGNDAIDGSAGDDVIRGGNGDDTLYSGAGVDSLFGEDGDDSGLLDDDSDSFIGGAGTDTAIIFGAYASFTARISPDTEVLLIASGTDTRFGTGHDSFDYNIVFPNGPDGANPVLTVQATGLGAGEDLRFDGSAQQNGAFRIFAGRGVDQLTGGGRNDGFFFDADANGSLTGADSIDGGGGTDTLALRGDYTGGRAVTFTAASMTAVEVLAFLTGHANPYGGPIVAGGFDYSVTMADGNVAAGAQLDVIGTTLGADEKLTFDGRAETDGSFRLIMGAGDDALLGGQRGDMLYGGLGADQIDGSGGADTYVYRDAAESTAASPDQVTLGEGDRIDLAAIDADSGTDGDQTFAFIGADPFGQVAGQLRAQQSGDIWIVEGDLDGDGIADLVIHVTGADPVVAGDFLP